MQGNASQLDFENAVRQEGVSPETINKLPLVVVVVRVTRPRWLYSSRCETPAAPPAAYDARINGGLKSGDEAVMDGVSMQEGTMSQGGMVAFYDFRMTPDMISEFRVMTSTLFPRIWRLDRRSDHRHHEIRDGTVPRGGIRVPPQQMAKRHAVRK